MDTSLEDKLRLTLRAAVLEGKRCREHLEAHENRLESARVNLIRAVAAQKALAALFLPEESDLQDAWEGNYNNLREDGIDDECSGDYRHESGANPTD